MAESSVPKRKRSEKGKEKASADPNLFQNEQHRKFYNEILWDIKVKAGRQVPLATMTGIGMDINPLFEYSGVRGLLRLNCPTYERLVRVAFARMEVYEDDQQNTSVECFVKGVKIVIDGDLLRDLLELPRGGSVLTIGGGDEITGYDFTTFSTELNRGVPLRRNEELLATHFTPFNRIVHSIIVHCVMCKTGGFDTCSRQDAYLLWHLLNRKKIDWAALILNIIGDEKMALEKLTVQNKEKKQGRRRLPFGMLWTQIFERFHVSLKGEIPTPLSKFDVYSDAMLQRMKMVRIVGDGWKYRRELEVGDEVFEEGRVSANTLHLFREKKVKGNLQQTRFIGRARQMQGIEEGDPAAMDVEEGAAAGEEAGVSTGRTVAQRLDSLDSEVKELRSSMDTVRTSVELIQMDVDESNEKLSGCMTLLQKIWDKLSTRRSSSSSPSIRSPLPPPSPPPSPPPPPPSDFPTSSAHDD